MIVLVEVLTYLGELSDCLAADGAVDASEAIEGVAEGREEEGDVALHGRVQLMMRVHSTEGSDGLGREDIPKQQLQLNFSGFYGGLAGFNIAVGEVDATNDVENWLLLVELNWRGVFLVQQYV